MADQCVPDLDLEPSSSAGGHDTQPEWHAQTAMEECFELGRYSEEWDVVEKQVKTLPEVRVVKVARIQNLWIWITYNSQKNLLHAQNNGVTNEVQVFHGTSDTNPRQIIYGRIGFNVEFSPGGMWGNGNYFSSSAAYADGFAHIVEDRCREMLLVNY